MSKPNNCMQKLHERLDKVATREQLLIEALSEALSNADRKLLDDVRSVTIEHEARRAVILTELQTLAARIGAFPAAEDPFPMIEDDTLDLPYTSHYEEEPPPPPPSNGADWRKAAENIRDDLAFAIGPRRVAS